MSQPAASDVCWQSLVPAITRSEWGVVRPLEPVMVVQVPSQSKYDFFKIQNDPDIRNLPLKSFTLIAILINRKSPGSTTF